MQTGQPSVIRNHSEPDRKAGHVLISSKDGAPNYVMLHNDPMPPCPVSHGDTGGHSHQWEQWSLLWKDRPPSYATARTTPYPRVMQCWCRLMSTTSRRMNESQAPVVRVTYNPVASEAAEH